MVAPNPTAHFETSEGNFEAEIYLDRVPITASNFIDLCRSGFYDGLHFHRCLEGFMNQFGCPYSRNPNAWNIGQGSPPVASFTNLKNGSLVCRGPGGTIKDEHISVDSNLPLTLSMANVGQPNTGGSQMFINVAYNHSLDWFTPGTSKHPVFGIVKTGMGVVINISKTKVDRDRPGQGRPMRPIKMIKITISGAPADANSKTKGKSSSSSSSPSSSRPRRRNAKRKKDKKRKSSSSSSSSSRAKKDRKRKSSSSSSSSSRAKKPDKKRRR